MNGNRTYAREKIIVKDWNGRNPIGTLVDVTEPDGKQTRTKTITGATLLGGHTPVIYISGSDRPIPLCMVKRAKLMPRKKAWHGKPHRGFDEKG